MNKLLTGLLKAAAYLPWWVIYRLSDLTFLLLYYVVGYRRKVVMANLAVAFPDMSHLQRKQIARRHYRYLADLFLEMLKIPRMSGEELKRRIICPNAHLLEDLHAKGRTVNILCGHFFSFEMGNLGLAAYCPQTFVGVYMPLHNRTMDDYVFALRSRFGTKMIPALGFKEAFAPYADREHALALVGDQSTGNAHNAFWMPFFGKLTPFARGPYKASHERNTAVILCSIEHVKRGHYLLHLELLTENGRELSEQQMALTTMHFIEDSIRRHPSDYLWTHRRWKREFDAAEFGHLVVKD